MKSKILHVHDEAEWRRMVGIFLKLAGFGVLSAADGSEAIAQADLENPDAVILDINLAGEDGAALIGYLKAINPDIPIVLYTGLEHDAAAIQRLLDHGAVHYLRKGNLQDLVKYVEELLRKRAPGSRPVRQQVVQVGGWQMV